MSCLRIIAMMFGCGLSLAANAQSLEVAEPVKLPKAGLFGAGFGLEVLGVGPVETFSRGGVAAGFNLTAALQFDVGPRWAFRLPLALDYAGRESNTAFIDIALSPGVLYRWRDRADQRWIPYAGAGLRLASQGVRRDFVGEPLLVKFDLDDHHGSGSDDPNLETELATVVPEFWAGFELHPSRWFAANIGLTYAWVRARGVNVQLLRQTIGARFTF